MRIGYSKVFHIASECKNWWSFENEGHIIICRKTIHQYAWMVLCPKMIIIPKLKTKISSNSSFKISKQYGNLIERMININFPKAPSFKLFQKYLSVRKSNTCTFAHLTINQTCLFLHLTVVTEHTFCATCPSKSTSINMLFFLNTKYKINWSQ